MTSNAVNSETLFKNLHQDLIDGCKAGDQKAYFQIYKLYYKSMYHTSLRIAGDKMDAEDIMQESFLSAFEKIDTYSGTVSFGAWLKRIVINRSLDYLAKKRKLNFEDIESFTECSEYFLEEIYLDEEDNLNLGEIFKAIERLPEKSRIVISLYLIEGYDHDEISEILSISSSTSRSQLSRAKRKLQEDHKIREILKDVSGRAIRRKNSYSKMASF